MIYANSLQFNRKTSALCCMAVWVIKILLTVVSLCFRNEFIFYTFINILNDMFSLSCCTLTLQRSKQLPVKAAALTSKTLSIKVQLGQNHSLILILLTLITFFAGKNTYEFAEPKGRNLKSQSIYWKSVFVMKSNLHRFSSVQVSYTT